MPGTVLARMTAWQMRVLLPFWLSCLHESHTEPIARLENLAEQGRAGNIRRIASVKGWVLDRARHARGVPLARGSARSPVPRQTAPLTATPRTDQVEIAGTRSARPAQKTRGFVLPPAGRTRSGGGESSCQLANRRQFPETARIDAGDSRRCPADRAAEGSSDRHRPGWVKQGKPRRGRPRRGRRRYRSRGSHKAMWVAPSSIGCSSLTRRQRTQFGPNSGAAILRFR